MSRLNGATPYPPRMQRSFSKLAQDALDLAELQFKLFKLDTKRAGRIVWTTLILAAIGFAVLVAALPVGLLALAEVLVENNGWSRMEALGAVSGGGLALCAILLAIGWWNFSKALCAWQRSSEELTRNIEWLKHTLSGGEEPPISEARKSFH